MDEKHSMRFQIKTSGLACVLTVFEQFDGVMKTGKRDKDRQSREELGLLKPPSNAGYLRFRIGPLQDTVTWPYGIMGRKLHSRPFKTKESRAGLIRVPVFWKFHCATCVPV